MNDFVSSKDFEPMLATLLADIASSPLENIDDEIIRAQRELCQYFGTDRSALWQGSEKFPYLMTLTHLCTLDEIPPVPEGVTANKLFPWVTQQLIAGQAVVVPDINNLPAEAQIDHDSLLFYGDKSTLAIPITKKNGTIHCALSFARTTRSFNWTPAHVNKGQLIAQTLINVIDLKSAEADLRISAIAFESQESLIITDSDGVILRVNKAFTESTGYTAEEIVGQTPRVFKSGRHGPEFYKAMWESLHRTGTWQGEIWDRRKNGEIYPKWLCISAVKRDDGIISHFVGSHIDITDRKTAEEKIQHLAFYDQLTGLPNRLLFLDRLNQALASSARSNKYGALLFIDMDNFKNLNDTLGHDMGDTLLKQVTQRLESSIREGDTVARPGGDEFVVMLCSLSDQPIEAATQTETIGDNILASLSKPYQLDKNTYRCTASIGVTLFYGAQHSTDDLMKQADIAMYQAKKAGRNIMRFFDIQMQEIISARVSLDGELQNALEFQQLYLHYQIQVDTSHRPLGAEALIRWMHPTRGLVSPAQFIPLAEETGLILTIGQWVLETACAQLKTWQQDELTRDLVLAINVSPKQFRKADFVAHVRDTVRRHAINPSLLKLELTESMLLEDFEFVIATMNDLNGIGIRFSLDDFGTGYSSLQYLKRLPLNQLKIDKSFIRDIATDSSDKAIVSTIIAMAQILNLDVIAEGVETEEQRKFLLNSGCTNFQGYLFGRPVPIEQFETQLKQGLSN